MASALERLEAWYLSQCDEEWEHAHGITVETLDNPGWRIKIDLAATRWAGREFAPRQHDRAEHDWLRCWVKGTEWQAAVGPCNLEEVLTLFLDWVGADDSPAPRGEQVDDWLRQRWLDRQGLSQQPREDSDG
jgi:hypothetical protein